MKKKKFAVEVINSKHKIFVVHIALPISFEDVYPFCRPQIAGLITRKAFTKIFAKYTNFTDVFSLDLAFEFFNYIGINNCAIELVKG